MNVLICLKRTFETTRRRSKYRDWIFLPLNYSFPTKIQYAYKMEGVDKDWVYIKDGRQFAYYNRLPLKGKHTFLCESNGYKWVVE